jgi:hypothetical protein
VTELNSVGDNPGKQSTSLVNGLFLADAIGNLARTEFNACVWWDLRNGAGFKANNNPLLYGWRQYGDYGLLSSNGIQGAQPNTRYPSFYAAKLLTDWAAAGDPILSATSGYPLLAIHAARHPNGDLALLVINKNPDADLPTQITLNHFTPVSRISTYSYGKPNDLSRADITTGTASIPSATFTFTFPSYSMTVLVLKGQDKPAAASQTSGGIYSTSR